jgi:hypothetical protein
MKSLLSEISKKLTEDQQKVAEAIDITKNEDEIISDFMTLPFKNPVVGFLQKKFDFRPESPASKSWALHQNGGHRVP